MNKLFATIIACLFYCNSYCQSVSINTDGGSADSSAILDVKSSSKGVLVPRLTNTQKNLITNPAIGLLIFQTDSVQGFHYYNGTSWLLLAVSTSLNNNTLLYTSRGF